MKYSIYLLLALAISCNTQQTSQEPSGPTGPFFGIIPTDTPQMLFPDLISSELGEINGCFLDTGTCFFYTVSFLGYDAIAMMEMNEDGSWEKPHLAPFSGKYPEFDPIISPDGKRLYFSSHRPLEGTEESDRSRIFSTESNADGSWSEPQHIALTGRGDYHSSVTHDGTIYFNVWNDGNLYKASPGTFGYVTEQLNDTLNSTNGDGDPFIAADESYIIFRSYRNGGPGNGDLFISFNTYQSKDSISFPITRWTIPQPLPEPINSPAREMTPYVTPDGKYFTFASNRYQESYTEKSPANLDEVKQKFASYDNGNHNIYFMDAGFIEEMRKALLLLGDKSPSKKQ